MPAWERAALPLVYCGDELAAVPGIGVELRFQAQDDAAGVAIEWLPSGVGAISEPG